MTFEQWFYRHARWENTDDPELNIRNAAEAAWEAAVNHTMATMPQGHDEFCEFCGERCDGYAGNPGKWPIGFTHPDGTGKTKWHHTECVQERLFVRYPK